MGKSLMQELALMPEEERAKVLAGVDMDALMWDWSAWARPEQRPPDGVDWAVWIYLAGRGAGKSRSAAEWVREKAKYTNQGLLRFLLMARTAADIRDTVVEGESGVLNVSPPSERPHYEPSKRRLTWPNGNMAVLLSADEPDSARGVQGHYSWCVSGDTLIATPVGDKRLRDICIGDEVLTRVGWKKVLDKAFMGWKDTITIRTDEGHLTCTPDHRIWVEDRGWVRADSVFPCDSVLAWKSRRDLLPGLSGMASGGTETRKMGTTETVRGSFFITPYGSLSTGQFPTGMSSTTSTTSRAITDSRILSLSHVQNIRSIMPKTERMIRKHFPSERNDSGSRRSLAQLSAPIAERNTNRQGHAPDSAHAFVLSSSIVRSVEQNSVCDVYDLVVDEAHEFVAGGMLVHNCDELAAWRGTPDAAGMTAWDNLRVATRLGSHPQIVITTTPKRVPILYALIEEAKRTGRVIISKGATMDNSGNLSEAYIDAIFGVYQGTRLARQELDGEMLDDVEGALWMLDMIEEARQGLLPPSAPLRVVGVDPSVAENPRDECGIVVCASTAERDLYKRHAWVLEDASVLGSPEVWASKVVEMARRWGAPVVAEVNQGGALVRGAINSIDPTIKVYEVHSKYGKSLRAEPIVLAYEQQRVHHIGYLADLESQMCLIAGTLIETSRGHIPIEDVTSEDFVQTRTGLAPLIWAGQTGVTNTLTSIIHEEGGVVSTPCHPFFNPLTGQFVSAENVRLGDPLSVRPSPARMAPQSSGAARGGAGCPQGISGEAGDQGNYSIAQSGEHTTEIFQKAALSTTSTIVPETTASKTLQLSRRKSTQQNTQNVAGQAWPKNSGKPMEQQLGFVEKHSPSFVEYAEFSTTQQECVLLSAQTLNVVDLKKTVLPESITPVPVYNLTVAEGYLPEFYANGILVHNCSWIPGETSKSPDRVDALVHGMHALLIKPPPNFLGGSLTAKSLAGRQIPLDRRRRQQPGSRRGGRVFTVR